MNYEDAIDILYDSRMMGTKLGLNNIRCLLQALGDPHLSFACVHVAGTNGKGSVSAMLSSMLTRAGYKTGLFTSPHLSSFRERIRTGQEFIQGQSVADILERIIEIGESMRTMEGVTFPTFFEIVTAMGAVYFADSGVDIAVMETGMGGRLDATNAMEADVSIITNIGMEHSAYLGDTIEKIAFEKGGIIKENVPLITAEKDPVALEVIEGIASEKNAPVIKVGREVVFSDLKFVSGELEKPMQSLTVTTKNAVYSDLRTPLIGLHQAENCCIALAAIEALGAKGFQVSTDAVESGLADTQWPGRFEIVGENPVVILDAACNPAAVQTLAHTLEGYLGEGRKVVFVLGFLQDKDYALMCQGLFSLAAEIVLTRPANSRAADPVEVMNSLGNDFDSGKIHITKTVPEAIEIAYNLAEKKDGFVCVAGSNYLLGEARQKLGLAELKADFMLSDNL
jgi:dihydrofolate synthase / folylpolyglutamate synthase